MSFTDFQQSLPKILQNQLTARFLYNRSAKYNVRNIPTGNCNFCERLSETLYPAYLELCYSCFKRLTKNGKKQRIVKQEVVVHGFTCDWCGRKDWRKTIMNPYICEKCVRHFYTHGSKKRQGVA